MKKPLKSLYTIYRQLSNSRIARPNDTKGFHLTPLNISSLEALRKDDHKKSLFIDNTDLLSKPFLVQISEKEVFDATKEGLYRFISTKGETRQVIVYNGDLQILFFSIGSLFLHSSGSDNFLSTSKLLYICHKRQLKVTCGTTARVAAKILQRINLRCRVASFFSLDDWNSYDNGHTALEYWSEEFNKWILLDFDLKCYFLSTENDKPLGLMELVNQSKFKLKFFAPRQIANGNFKDNDPNFLTQSIFLDDQAAFNWLKKKLVNPVIHLDGIHYSHIMKEEDSDLVKKYFPNYIFCDKEQFTEIYNQ